jgi:inosine-uridine nucleoside N-ribohydrolase
MATRRRILFDCDNTMGLPHREIDDGLTLLYLLGRPDVELLGVTTTFGNGSVAEAHVQTEELLRRVGRSDVPAVLGAGARHASPTAAARFLVEMVDRYPGEVTLLATGPLGNLRGAAELDSKFFDRAERIACMGGVLRPLQIGHHHVPELNLSADPAAAYQVLHASCPVTLMNAHVCLQASFTEEDLDRVPHWSEEVRSIVQRWLDTMRHFSGASAFYLWDLLPAVYLSCPELFDRHPVWVRSSIADLETGQIVVGETGEGAQVNMPSQIRDVGRFKEILFAAWRQVSI